MGTLQEKQIALKVVLNAAGIHNESLKSSILTDRSMQRGFKDARQEYINKLSKAISEVQSLKMEEDLKVKERVGDLDLEQSVDLLIAVEDHIRELRRNHRSSLT
jgi:hypothetical protein